MPLLLAEAEKLSQNDLVRGVIEEFIDTDELFQFLNFVETKGKSYDYVREKTLATGAWLDPSDPVPESASTFQEVTTKLRILIGDVDVDKFMDGTLNDKNAQKAIQIASKVKGMSQQYRNVLINGDIANKEFNGISKLTAPGQIIDAGPNGNPLSFSMLDELTDAVKTGAGGIFMRRGTFRAYMALLRAAGGNTPERIQIRNSGVSVPAHNGTPIFLNDYIKGDVTHGSANDTCSIFAVNFDESHGLHGIYGGGPAGFVIEDIGTVQNKDSTRTRIKMYSGLALKSTLSLAEIQGVTNV